MKIITTSLSQRIADSIVELIDESKLRPGDALQSSRSLATHFDVTLPTIREALRRLEATDVIRFRHGSGTYVGEGVGRRLMANPHAATGGRASIIELIEARIVLEPTIAAEAAAMRTEADLISLDQVCGNALVPQEADERPALHFHVALARASGNRLLAEMLEALLDVRAADQVAIRHSYNDRERDHREHREIVAAVRDQDPVAAADVTRAHLRAIRDAVAESVDRDSTGERQV